MGTTNLFNLPFPGPNNRADVAEYIEALASAIDTALSTVSGGTGSLADGSITNAKVSNTAGISLDKTADSATRLAMTNAERSKLSGVADNATSNDTDANLKSRANHTGTQTSSTIIDLSEAVQDIVGAFIVAGSGVTVSYNDTANTFTINATATGSGETDPEIVRDVIGTALVAGSGVQITVNDAGDTITVASTAVLPTRKVVAGTGLSGGGDLSADRTLSVSYGTAAGTAAQGNDSRLSDTRTPTDLSVTNAKVASAAAISADKLADGTTNKVMTAAERVKLAGVATGATAAETVTTVGTLISGATAKTTPVDADTIGLSDSTATNVLKKVSWSDLKATLKTYLDTLYAAASHTHTASNISDSTAIGRSILTSSDASAVRTAITAARYDAAQTFTGVQTFSSAPVVPDSSFAIAKTNGLQPALDAKLTSTATLTQVGALLTALQSGFGLDVSVPYATASGMSTRPSLPTNWRVRIFGGTTSDADPTWMINGDYRDLTAA